ncbi:MAG TPA: M23 family metallopeptidase [Rectinemataceae bacterium]|nr:M23 family metallopeptidase [Rectinemataceae bacterium]
MPSLLRSLKKRENDAWRWMAAHAGVSARAAGSRIARFFRASTQEITILLVPHTERPSRGLRIPLYGLVLAGTLVAGMLGGAAYFLLSAGSITRKLSVSDSAFSAVKTERDQLQDQISLFDKAYRGFKAALDSENAALGRTGAASLSGATGFPFAPRALFAKRPTALQEIEAASASLDAATGPMEEYGKAIQQMDQIKETVPAVWPIKDGAGHMSFPFGPEPNPFTGEMYFHTGIDASTYRSGDPIVATGDGVVVFAGVDGGYGRCVFIMHAHGYYTRYGHMERILVYTGQKVKQGQVIGLIGMTGVATGPHVHYEVIIGSQYVDPLDYLWSDTHATTVISQGPSDHD